MNRDVLLENLASLKPEIKREAEYLLYRFGSENDSNLLLAVYIYNDNEASLSLEAKGDPELYVAYKAYEKVDFQSESELFKEILKDLFIALEQGIECHAKNGILFHNSMVILAKSKKCLFSSSALKFGNFKLPKTQGLIGVFQPYKA